MVVDRSLVALEVEDDVPCRLEVGSEDVTNEDDERAELVEIADDEILIEAELEMELLTRLEDDKRVLMDVRV